MIHFSMAFLVGVLFQLSLAVLIDWKWLLILLFIPVGLFYFKHRLSSIVLALLLGSLNVAIVGEQLKSNLLPQSLENKIIVIRGEVISPPITDTRKIKFDFAVQHIEGYGDYRAKIKLSWYIKRQAVPTIEPGDVYNLSVKLKRPNGFHNKNRFDYQTWLFINKYSATGYVKKSIQNKRISSTPCVYMLACLRNQLIVISDDLLKQSDYKGIVQALVLGVKNAISREQQQIMIDTGTNHLLAISGLHIGIIALLFYAIAKWFWRQSLFLQTRFMQQHFSLATAFIVCVFYAAMAGFSLPTQRALFMFFALLLSQFLYRNSSLWNSYFLALLMVLVISPLSPLSAGFWLSFVAVAIIITVINWSKNKAFSKVQMAFIIQLALVVFLSPFIMLHFHTVNLHSLLANLFAVPVASFVIIPFSFILMMVAIIYMPLAKLLLWLLEQILYGYFEVLNVIDSIFALKWHSNIDVSAITLLFFISIFVVLFKWKKPLALVFLLISLGGLIFKSDKKPLLKVHVFDVGQGLSVLVQTKNKTLLYDTGPAYSNKFTAVQSIVIPYLNSHGIKEIDKLVLSHSDADHIGDYKKLLTSIKVKKVETGQPAFFDNQFKSCHLQAPWRWDNVHFEYLFVAVNSKKDNDFSCVLKITVNKTILLTGDIEKKVELALVQKYQNYLQSDVIVVPHHGSKSSSSNVFLDAVKPKIAISSNGYLNRFKHPASLVVARYQHKKIRFYTTAKQGALTVSINTDSKKVKVTSDVLTHFNKWFHGLNQ